MTPRAVGIVGLGSLGLALAQRLLAKDYVVTGYRRSGAHQLVELGGVAAMSPADVAAASDMVLTCLPDAAALTDVMQSLRPALAARHVIVDLTTSDPQAKRAAAEIAVAAGAAFIDAPISGQPRDVEAGDATLFVGGASDAIARCTDVLADVGRFVVVGNVGDGARMKLVATVSLAIQVMATAEIFETGRAFGFSAQTVLDAVGASPAGFPQFVRRGALVALGEQAPRTDAQQTFAHNLEAIVRYAEGTDATMPLFAVVRDFYQRGLAGPFGDRDSAVLLAQALREARHA